MGGWATEGGGISASRAGCQVRTPEFGTVHVQRLEVARVRFCNIVDFHICAGGVEVAGRNGAQASVPGRGRRGGNTSE